MADPVAYELGNKLVPQLKRIADYLEKQGQRKSIGAIFYQLYKLNDTSQYTNEDIDRCVAALRKEYPGAIYTAEVTATCLPQTMQSIFIRALQPKPTDCAKHIVNALERAGFWED